MRAPGRIREEAGAASLGAVLLLMMLLTLAVLYAHRGLLFEQRSAANQYRAAQAFELAEAGIEWGAAMLNDPRRIDAECRPASGSGSFRDRQLAVDGRGMLQPLPAGTPSCRWKDGAMTCTCPGSEGATSDDPDDAAMPRFATALEAMLDDAGLVRLSARGCAGAGTECVAGAGTDGVDARAQSSVVLRWLPGLRTMPVAALTAGGSVELGGGVAVTNRDAGRGGGLVHAGLHITVAGSAMLAGPAGTPPTRLLREHDAALAAGAMSVALLGTTTDGWARRANVRRIGGSSAAQRGAELLAAHAQGYRAFHADGDLLFDAQAIGSPDEPLLLTSGHRMACTRPCRVHGLVYGDMALRAASDLEHVTVQGAVVTRGHHAQSGTGGIEYDAHVLARVRELTGFFVKVPGSWRDF